MDTGDLKKDPSEMPGVRCFRLSPAPGQSLALNVNQTALQYDARPQGAKRLHQTRIAINSKAAGPQAPLDERAKKRLELRPGAFRNSILTGNEPVGTGVHKSHEALRPVNEGAIDNHMLAAFQVNGSLRRRLRQMVVNHTCKLPGAVSALFDQLPDGIAFDDPAPEPFLLVGLPDADVTPAKGAPAFGTKPSLPAISIVTIFPGRTRAFGAVFF